MPEIVDYHQYEGFGSRQVSERDDFVGWMLLESITLAGKVEEVLDVRPAEKLEVCLTINGIELPFVATLQLLHDQLDQQIRKAAKETFEKELGEATTDVTDALRDLKRTVREKVFGLDPTYDGDE